MFSCNRPRPLLLGAGANAHWMPVIADDSQTNTLSVCGTWYHSQIRDPFSRKRCSVDCVTVEILVQEEMTHNAISFDICIVLYARTVYSSDCRLR